MNYKNLTQEQKVKMETEYRKAISVWATLKKRNLTNDEKNMIESAFWRGAFSLIEVDIIDEEEK